MLAVIEYKKKQYKAEEGTILLLPYFETKDKVEIVFDKILFYADDKKVSVGRPYLKDIKIKADILGEKKEKKISVLKFHPKKRYQRVKNQKNKFIKVKIKAVV